MLKATNASVAARNAEARASLTTARSGTYTSRFLTH